MIKKKKFIFSLIALLFIGILSSCGTEEISQKITGDTSETKELRLSFGVMPAVDSLRVLVAQKEGFFEAEGLTVDLQVFKSPKDRDAALTSGNLDGANTDLIAVSTYLEGDMDFQVVSQSTGVFSILTNNPEIQTVTDLKGKKVGLKKDQAPYYFMAKSLETRGLEVADISYEEVPQIPIRVELVTNQKLDATVVPEPFRTIGLSNGLRELDNSNELDINATVFGFTTKSLEENSEAISAFYKGYNQAVDYINDNELDDYYSIMKDNIGYTEEIKGRVTLPPYTHAEQVEVDQLTDALKWSKQQGIYSKELKPDEVLSDFLER